MTQGSESWVVLPIYGCNCLCLFFFKFNLVMVGSIPGDETPPSSSQTPPYSLCSHGYQGQSSLASTITTFCLPYIEKWAKNDQVATSTSNSEKTLYPIIPHSGCKNWYTNRNWNHGDGWQDQWRIWDFILLADLLAPVSRMLTGDSWVRDKRLLQQKSQSVRIICTSS